MGTGSRSATKIVDVSNGSAPSVQIDFNEGFTVTGHVTQNGSPVTAGNVNFSPKTGGTGGSGGTINNDGSYTVTGLQSGDFVVRVFGPMGISYQADDSVASNSTFDIDMKGATLRGRVSDADTGDAVSGAMVYLEPPKGVNIHPTTMTDGEGRFTLSALPDGTMNVHASREQYAAQTQEVVVTGGSVPDVDLKLSRGQEAIIRIVDAVSGSPITGNVSLWSGRKNIGASATPGDDRAMHVWVAPGKYRATVGANGYVTGSADVTVPGPEVRVELSRAGMLRITSKAGGLVRITLAGLPLSSNGAGGVVVGSRMMNVAAGTPMLTGGFAPGHYTVDLLESDRTTVKRSYAVDIVAGQTAELSLD
jgi:carboxypeptidase family protein